MKRRRSSRSTTGSKSSATLASSRRCASSNLALPLDLPNLPTFHTGRHPRRRPSLSRDRHRKDDRNFDLARVFSHARVRLASLAQVRAGHEGSWCAGWRRRDGHVPRVYGCAQGAERRWKVVRGQGCLDGESRRTSLPIVCSKLGSSGCKAALNSHPASSTDAAHRRDLHPSYRAPHAPVRLRLETARRQSHVRPCRCRSIHGRQRPRVRATASVARVGEGGEAGCVDLGEFWLERRVASVGFKRRCFSE